VPNWRCAAVDNNKELAGELTQEQTGNNQSRALWSRLVFCVQV
jgi:hypothetical protein